MLRVVRLIHSTNRKHRFIIFLAVVVGLAGASGLASAQTPPPISNPPASLKTVPVPVPSNLGDFVRDQTSAIQLGKALFWDQQVGGDGIQSCASCHFHAGADNRRKNQLNPGINAGDTTFQLGGPNYTLRPEDFPITTNDVVSSQGVFNTTFIDVAPPQAADSCNHVPDAVFHVGAVNTRRVEPRNAPTMINAVFNFRNFWDGRANQIFNGASPFGQRDPNARVWQVQGDGSLQAVAVAIDNGSLASQASGPPTSNNEQSCAGRFWAAIGKKMLDPGIVPLGNQEVHPQDSALGPIANTSNGSRGLTVSYLSLVQKAFQPTWWSSSATVAINGQSYTLAQANFALFFGLAVQLYEATLVANNSRMDQYFDGNTSALTDLEKQGLDVFQNKGKCVNCHGGAETTNASVARVQDEKLERMTMGNGGCAIYDDGFYNTSVRPTTDDLAVGGTDPFGNPLSLTRLAMQGRFSDPNLDPPLGQVSDCDSRAAVDGAFKTPGLRNVELTGPFFHNGGAGTLQQVVDFYNRGGNFPNQNIANLDPDIEPLNLTGTEQASLVAFLQAMTDERVRQEAAPFDHPQLFRPQGHPGDTQRVAVQATGPGAGIEAQDDLFEVGAVGAGGRPAEGLVPLEPFLTVTHMTGSGSLGSGSTFASFDFKFRETNGSNDGFVQVRDASSKQTIVSTSVASAFTTENCVQLAGAATVNGNGGFSYAAKACDHGQFKSQDKTGQSLRRDTFAITVADSTGNIVYSRGDRLSGGNITAHIQ